jgi:hypothetical protein
MKEEATTKELATQEGLVELINITQLLTQLVILMHLRIQEVVQMCLLSDIKEEYMSGMV